MSDERGRAALAVASPGSARDNGDNLRRRDINRGAIWPDERDEKSKEGCENCGHILMPLATPLYG